MAHDAHNELAKAIVARWQAVSALSGIRGPSRGQAPPANLRTLPYCVFGVFVDRATLIATTPTSEIREHEFDLRIYDRTPELCGDHAAKLREAFSTFLVPSTLVMPTGLKCTKIRPGDERYGRSAARGEEFVEWVIEFTTTQARSL